MANELRSADVCFHVLGPLAATNGSGAALPLGPPRRRALLAALLVHQGTALSVDRLTELLWDGAAPPTAPTMVHGAVAGLRRALGAGAPAPVVTRDGGYTLPVGPGRLDAARFEQLLAEGRRLVEVAPARATRLLAEALGLWRGPALAGIDLGFAREAAGRWEELRLECTEAHLAAELALGHHRDVVAELAGLAGRHPFREALWAQLAVALYRCGRQAEALDALRAVRRTLAEELGVAPGPDLRELEAAVLRQSPDLGLGRARAPDPRAGRTLPAPLTAFVGRVRERDEIAALVTAQRLVTLTGPGGAGKTRLAVEVGRRLGDRDGTEVWFVDLAPLTTPELVAGTVAGVLGVRAVPGEPLAGTAAAALAGRPAVLLLDNCEHLADAAAAFVRSLLAAAPDVRVLATSREALHLPGEQVVAVHPLATADRDDDWERIAACEAVQLFARRAAAARPGFAVTPANARLVLEVCRRLDALPLALELAATRAASMPLADLLERLDDRFRLLDGSIRSPGLRHRGLAATLAWSTGLLDEPARLLFARIPVFPAAFGLAAAEDVTAGDGLPGRDVALVLARLVAASLVQLEEGPDGVTRYRLLETTREYARQGTDDGCAAALRGRHARHYLALAQEAEPHLLGPASAPWLARLHAEHDNLRAALEWAFGTDGDARLGARLVGCLWHPWDVGGRRDEGLHWVRAGLAALGTGTDPDRLPLLSAGALLALGRAEFADVAALAQEQLTLARATGSAAWTGDALAMTATVAWAHGELDRARQLYEDAVASSLAGGDTWRAALAEAQLARLHRDRDEPEAARAVGLRGLHHAEEVGEELARGLTVDVLASVEHRWGDAATARCLVDEALEHYRAVGYLEGEASALSLLGRIALGGNEPGPARDAFVRSLRLCLRLGHRAGSAGALEGLAGAATATGDDSAALFLLGAAGSLRAEIGNPLTGGARADVARLHEVLVGRTGPVEARRVLRRGAGRPLTAFLEQPAPRSAGG